MKNIHNIKIACIYVVILLLFTVNLAAQPYTVIIDPGHGGASLEPVSIYGDKFDPHLREFLIPYKQGAGYRSFQESEIVYKVGRKITYYLNLLKTKKGKRKFYRILKKYSKKAKFPKHNFNVIMSRKKGLPIVRTSGDYEPDLKIDYNRPFRLYDMPNIATGRRLPGKISRMNSHEPNLIVSIHFTGGYIKGYGGLFSIVTPSLKTYKKAIDYVQGSSDDRKSIETEINSGPYKDWFRSDLKRSSFQWFICDAWVYFSGYWSTTDGLEPNMEKFRGLRFNYVTWPYQEDYWSKSNSSKPIVDQVKVRHLKNFKLNNAFWEREASQPEMWRRDEGPEGVGGDNLYASNELIRYIRRGLYVNGVYKKSKLPALIDPYYSTWSIPTHVNAINAFIELGYSGNKHDKRRLRKYITVQAEAIAVAVYSLFYGLPGDPKSEDDMPWGTPVDFAKYENHKDGNYFKAVTKEPKKK